MILEDRVERIHFPEFEAFFFFGLRMDESNDFLSTDGVLLLLWIIVGRHPCVVCV